MKLSLEQIDNFYFESGDCDDYFWDESGPEPIANINRIRKIISDRSGVHEKYIDITWCAPVVEYCLYVNGKWSGYVDFNEEYDNCLLSFEHIENYDEYIESRKN